jgi:hypothetical protein
MVNYIVKSIGNETHFLDFESAVKEAESLAEEGKNAYVYKEVDGVREGEPLYSCYWGI